MEDGATSEIALLLANFCSIIFDYVARRKIQSRNLNKYIIEQLPVVPPSLFKETHFGDETAADIIHKAVLELTYTSNNMASFARDLGHVDVAGNVKPMFAWDGERRLRLQAKLDAIFSIYTVLPMKMILSMFIPHFQF